MGWRALPNRDRKEALAHRYSVEDAELKKQWAGVRQIPR
jgi:hypothetical protein